MDYSNFKCPISHQIFLVPVFAADGYTYEKDCIIEWFKQTNGKSPMTNLHIGNEIIPNHNMKKIIEEYVDENTIAKEQYRTEVTIKDVILKNKNIKDIEFFNWKDIVSGPFSTRTFFELSDDNLKYLIDHSMDLEVELNINGKRPIHYVCEYASFEVIKYLISKNIDLEKKENCGWAAINYVCYMRAKNLDILKCIVEKGVMLNHKLRDGWTSVHQICRFGTLETITYLLSKDVDISIKNDNGNTPFYLLNTNSNIT